MKNYFTQKAVPDNGSQHPAGCFPEVKVPFQIIYAGKVCPACFVC